MWYDHPFSQRNKLTKRAVGWRLEVTGKRDWKNFEKTGLGNIGVFHEIEG